MLLFIDESGHDNSGTPCEVLAGVALAEDNLWNLVRAVRAAEREHFGDYLRNFLVDERKAKRLLKTKRFKSANRQVHIAEQELAALAHSALAKGKKAKKQGLNRDGPTEKELGAYSAVVRPVGSDDWSVLGGFDSLHPRLVLASQVDATAGSQRASIVCSKAT